MGSRRSRGSINIPDESRKRPVEEEADDRGEVRIFRRTLLPLRSNSNVNNDSPQSKMIVYRPQEMPEDAAENNGQPERAELPALPRRERNRVRQQSPVNGEAEGAANGSKDEEPDENIFCQKRRSHRVKNNLLLKEKKELEKQLQARGKELTLNIQRKFDEIIKGAHINKDRRLRVRRCKSVEVREGANEVRPVQSRKRPRRASSAGKQTTAAVADADSDDDIGADKVRKTIFISLVDGKLQPTKCITSSNKKFVTTDLRLASDATFKKMNLDANRVGAVRPPVEACTHTHEEVTKLKDHMQSQKKCIVKKTIVEHKQKESAGNYHDLLAVPSTSRGPVLPERPRPAATPRMSVSLDLSKLFQAFPPSSPLNLSKPPEGQPSAEAQGAPSAAGDGEVKMLKNKDPTGTKRKRAKAKAPPANSQEEKPAESVDSDMPLSTSQLYPGMRKYHRVKKSKPANGSCNNNQPPETSAESTSESRNDPAHFGTSLGQIEIVKIVGACDVSNDTYKRMINNCAFIDLTRSPPLGASDEHPSVRPYENKKMLAAKKASEAAAAEAAAQVASSPPRSPQTQSYRRTPDAPLDETLNLRLSASSSSVVSLSTFETFAEKLPARGSGDEQPADTPHAHTVAGFYREHNYSMTSCTSSRPTATNPDESPPPASLFGEDAPSSSYDCTVAARPTINLGAPSAEFELADDAGMLYIDTVPVPERYVVINGDDGDAPFPAGAAAIDVVLDALNESRNEVRPAVIPFQQITADARKPLHRTLVRRAKRKTLELTDTTTQGKSHAIHLDYSRGPVMRCFYFDYHLIITQATCVNFWEQSGLGSFLESQHMWVPRGDVQRLQLEAHCVRKETNECIVCTPESGTAYVELWTKEHKSEIRERPVCDVFAVLYFRRNGAKKPQLKLLQLENITGRSEDVTHVVCRHTNCIVVSWKSYNGKPSAENGVWLLRCYYFSNDYQKIVAIREFENTIHSIRSLHNIEDCDRLLLGCGDGAVSMWNLQFLFRSTSLDLFPDVPDAVRNISFKCDRGMLFALQLQLQDNVLRLVAINAVNLSWKLLQVFRPPAVYKRLVGACMEDGLVIAFYDIGIVCWCIESGTLLAMEQDNEVTFWPSSPHMVHVRDGHVRVNSILSYIITTLEVET